MTAPTIIGDCTLYLGDCMDILPTLGKVDAVVTDPPYGIGWDGENLSMSAGARKDGTSRFDKTWSQRRATGYEQMSWDTERAVNCIDYLSKVNELIVWGGNYYSDVLPPSGGWLVWDKLVSMPSLSKCELAWTNCIGRVERLSCLWAGYRKDEQGKREHPTQKPIELMQWCVGFVKAKTILDPFMGSGTTGLACIRTGRKFIGIEKEPKYFEIACKRIKAEYERTALFEPPPVVVVPTLFPVEGSPCEQS